jgi:hypothetical protein
MKRGISQLLLLLIAALAVLGFAACGGGSKKTTTTLPIPQVHDTPVDAAGIQAELAGMAVPEGVSAEVWAQVKAGFWQEWQRAQENKESSAASGQQPANQVDWIYALTVGQEYDQERETYVREVELRWRYKNVGDFNLNGYVQIGDLTVFAQQFGRSVADNPELEALDANGSGAIDVGDLTQFAMNYGRSCTSFGILGATSVDGPWTELGSVGIEMGEKLEFNMEFSYVVHLDFQYPSSPNPEQDNIVVLAVVPYDKDDNAGVRSLPTSAYYYTGFPPETIYALCGEPKELAGPFEEPEALVRWEFGSGGIPPSVETKDGQLTFYEPGEYEFWAIIFDGEATKRVDYQVLAIAPQTTPTTMSYIPTPQGPLLYWSKEQMEPLLTGSTLLRDGQPLAELAGDAFYYLDYRAGLGTHTYQAHGFMDELQVYSTEEVPASGEAVEGEHLYILTEPKEYTSEESLDVVVALVNNQHRLWMIPSLRIYVENGEVDRDVTNLTDEFAKAASVAWPPTELAVFGMTWPFSDDSGSGVEVSAGVGVLNWAGYGLPIPPTTPPGRTILLKPSGGSIEGGPGTVLRPYLNQYLPLSFYIDAYRNMHLFEYGHSFNLSTHEIGPAEPSPPYEGRLSLGKPPLPGDFDHDGVVSIADITPLAMHWGPGPINEENAFLDANGDRVLSLLDAVYILYYFGRTSM